MLLAWQQTCVSGPTPLASKNAKKENVFLLMPGVLILCPYAWHWFRVRPAWSFSNLACVWVWTCVCNQCQPVHPTSHAPTRIHAHTHTHIHIHIHTRARAHIHTHTHAHIHTHIHTPARTHIWHTPDTHNRTHLRDLHKACWRRGDPRRGGYGRCVGNQQEATKTRRRTPTHNKLYPPALKHARA